MSMVVGFVRTIIGAADAGILSAEPARRTGPTLADVAALFQDSTLPKCRTCGVPWEVLRMMETGTEEERKILKEHQRNCCGCPRCRGEVTELDEPDWEKLGLHGPSSRRGQVDWDSDAPQVV